MNEYYFNSKKYLFLLIIVCTLFLILVVKMFDYLPNYNDEDNNQVLTGNNAEQTIYKPEQKEQADNNIKTSEEDLERHKSGHIDFFKQKNNQSEYNIVEEIQAPKSVVDEDLPHQFNKTNTAVNTDSSALKSILNAKKFELSEDYSDAVSELQKVPELTSDNELLAMSYEEISNIYAKNGKYQTALSFAIKANKTSTSFAREVLIAKIYYKSGNTENAIKMINDALKRGF